MNLQELPKVELHLHLDCCLSFEAVCRLDPALTRADYDRDFVAPPKCRNLATYLRTPPHHVALMQTAAGLHVAVEELCAQLARDRVLYAELRFAPLLHTQRGLSPEQIVAEVEAAVGRCSAASGLDARIILCTLRHFGEAESMETVRLVERFRGSRVAAFDIAGDEAGYPVDAHLAAFRYAIAAGIPRTAHAGEAAGPASVWETLRHFRPSRIGHGVRSIGDEELLGHLRRTGVHLEVCPTCNVQTDVVPSYRDHPIDRLYRSGISLGINTDTRAITDVTLTQEYERLHRTFGWGVAHFRAVNLNAARASFLPPAERERLVEQVAAAYADWE